MSLINGMDDVIAYIKKLEDENKKMKNGLDDIYKVFTTPSSKPYTTKIKEAKNIINQVKVQDNNSVIDYKKLYEEQQEENKKLKEELEPLRELKKEADEECECMASVMMKKCMDDIEEKQKEKRKEFNDECDKKIKDMMNSFWKETKKIMCGLLDMNDCNDLEAFVNKINFLCSKNHDIDIHSICQLCDIELESDEALRDIYYEGGEITEQFIEESLGIERDTDEFRNMLESIKNSDEDDAEDFIEWYLNEDYSSWYYDCNSDYYFCIS